MIRIFCKNTQTFQDEQEGVTLLELLDHFRFEHPYPIVSAKVNNVSQGLKFRVYHNRDIEFVDVRDFSAFRVYCRSLCFVLNKAVKDISQNAKVRFEQPLSGGIFCKVTGMQGFKGLSSLCQQLKDRMTEIISSDMQFHLNEVHNDEAIRIFRDGGMEDKVKLLETSDQVYMDYYTLGDTVDYYYGRLLPSTSYLTVWGLEPYNDGLILRMPDHKDPTKLEDIHDQPKTFNMFAEHMRWNKIMGLRTVGDVNDACLKGHASELIQVSEALQEKKIVQIAEDIFKGTQAEKPVKVVLVTGPSSSGKTTFCKRLSIQLKACGLHPISMSTDDYFVNRIETPLLPNGQYDFDNFETVAHDVLQADVLKMLEGKTVEVPEYNFVTGIREYNGKKMALGKDSVLLIEGLHALNPRLTDKVPATAKYKIFISTLTSINLDDHNWIPRRDLRLLRRIVRDYNKGAFRPQETISQWDSVCEAEDTWITPYQEEADVMFNSALLIELAVLREHAEPILASVPKNCKEYCEAHHLLKFLRFFTPIPDKEIPPTSMLREFIGRSSFKY